MRRRGTRFLPFLSELDEEDREAVLAANREFYRAYNQRDAAAIDALWVRAGPMSCLHPNQRPLYERAAILRSWQAILAMPKLPPVRIVDVMLLGKRGLATIVCREAAPSIQLMATNVFIKEEDRWRMAHHQSGGVPSRPIQTPQPAPPKRDRRKLH